MRLAKHSAHNVPLAGETPSNSVQCFRSRRSWILPGEPSSSSSLLVLFQKNFCCVSTGLLFRFLPQMYPMSAAEKSLLLLIQQRQILQKRFLGFNESLMLTHQTQWNTDAHIDTHTHENVVWRGEKERNFSFSRDTDKHVCLGRQREGNWTWLRQAARCFSLSLFSDGGILLFRHGSNSTRKGGGKERPTGRGGGGVFSKVGPRRKSRGRLLAGPRFSSFLTHTHTPGPRTH